MKTIKSILFIISILSIVSCSEDETNQLRVSTVKITYQATLAKGCVSPSTYLLGIEDAKDIEVINNFNCNIASGEVNLSQGDLLEVRIYNNGPFDKSLLYDYSVIQDGVKYEFKSVNYTGIKYTVK